MLVVQSLMSDAIHWAFVPRLWCCADPCSLKCELDQPNDLSYARQLGGAV